jgi:hypothetical protein
MRQPKTHGSGLQGKTSRLSSHKRWHQQEHQFEQELRNLAHTSKEEEEKTRWMGGAELYYSQAWPRSSLGQCYAVRQTGQNGILGLGRVISTVTTSCGEELGTGSSPLLLLHAVRDWGHGDLLCCYCRQATPVMLLYAAISAVGVHTGFNSKWGQQGANEEPMG